MSSQAGGEYATPLPEIAALPSFSLMLLEKQQHSSLVEVCWLMIYSSPPTSAITGSEGAPSPEPQGGGWGSWGSLWPRELGVS